jgi:hypothetical protein
VTACKQFQEARTQLQSEVKVCDSHYFTPQFIAKLDDTHAVPFEKSVFHHDAAYVSFGGKSLKQCFSKII